MADRKKKKENPIAAYFRKTWAELKRVRWPTTKEVLSMTRIVLVITLGMALFLGVLDFFFGWLLSNIISGNALFMLLGAVVALALIGATYLIGQGEEV